MTTNNITLTTRDVLNIVRRLGYITNEQATDILVHSDTGLTGDQVRQLLQTDGYETGEQLRAEIHRQLTDYSETSDIASVYETKTDAASARSDITARVRVNTASIESNDLDISNFRRELATTRNTVVTDAQINQKISAAIEALRVALNTLITNNRAAIAMNTSSIADNAHEISTIETVTEAQVDAKIRTAITGLAQQSELTAHENNPHAHRVLIEYFGHYNSGGSVRGSGTYAFRVDDTFNFSVMVVDLLGTVRRFTTHTILFTISDIDATNIVNNNPNAFDQGASLHFQFRSDLDNLLINKYIVLTAPRTS